jgi:hypothetical protein
MKNYTIILETEFWSTKALKNKVENILNEKTAEGFEIVSVSFGLNLWWLPTAYITICK